MEKDKVWFRYEEKARTLGMWHGQTYIGMLFDVDHIRVGGPGLWYVYIGHNYPSFFLYAERRHLPGDLTVPEEEEEETEKEEAAEVKS